MKIYLAHSMSGLLLKDVIKYYQGQKKIFTKLGYDVLYPMAAKQLLAGEVGINEKIRPYGLKNSVISNHGIFRRDKWMVSQADVVCVDLLDSETVSIGCMFELAWACHYGKHTVVLMREGNIHHHAFVLEAADIMFDSLSEGIDYFKKLQKKSY